MNMINKINKLSRTEFIKVFANMFEKAKWIAEELHRHKPFNNFEELSSKMLNIFETSTNENKLKILNVIELLSSYLFRSYTMKYGTVMICRKSHIVY